MSLPVFISDTDAAVGEQVCVTGPEGRHAVTVKRITPGEKVMLIDGRGNARTCTVTATSAKDRLDLVVETVAEIPTPDPQVTIIQAIPKSERSDRDHHSWHSVSAVSTIQPSNHGAQPSPRSTVWWMGRAWKSSLLKPTWRSSCTRRQPLPSGN